MSARITEVGRRAPARIALLSVVSALFLLTAALSASASSNSDLWKRWTAHDEKSTFTIDHLAWTRFLGKYVRTDERGVNVVAYGFVDKPDLRNLRDYIGRLTIAPISSYSRNVQLAYWINLYNALTVKLILDHMPVESIRDIDISPGWFVKGPWGRKLARIEGVSLSLDDIEHRILRPIWQDARIHYAVNCAAIGCPNLQKKAYTGETADEMLTAAAREFVNDRRAAEFTGAELHISSLYKWYLPDFGGTPNNILIHLRKYAAPALRTKLGNVVKITGHRYDWKLNSDSVPPVALNKP